jgi:DNA helicase-2/ATP-dependent DNA helicase PcrA
MLSELKGSTTLQAYNKAIATEIAEKVAASDLNFMVKAQLDVRTVHSHGLAALKRGGIKARTDGGKVRWLYKNQTAGFDFKDPAVVNGRHVVNAVSLAKGTGFGLKSTGENFPAINDAGAWMQLLEHHNIDMEVEGWDLEDLIEMAQDLLRQSNKAMGSIDFDDMIYLPLLLDLPIPQYNNVLIDEAQDINATRRELAFRSVKTGGRLIAVGDPNQAIYGFSGADAESMDNIRSRLSVRDDNSGRGIAAAMAVMPLSICFRCDTAIIAEAKRIVPAIEPASWKKEGKVEHVQFLAPERLTNAPSPAAQTADFLDMPRPGDAILCRLNKPNVAVALGLLRRGIPAKIEGRDLGKRLLYHCQKATELYNHQPLDLTRLDLDAYREDEMRKLAAKNRESAAAMLEDEVDAVQLLIDRCVQVCAEKDSPRTPHVASFQQLEALVEQLFGDGVNPKTSVTLASVHKSKGREWSRVFILGWRDYMPFHLAVKIGGWQLEQEHNLRYVAITRAEHELVFVNGVQAALDKGAHREVRKPALPLGDVEVLATNDDGSVFND